MILGGQTYCEAMQNCDIHFEIETIISAWGFPEALTPPLIKNSTGKDIAFDHKEEIPAFMAHFESYMNTYQAIIDSEEK